MTMEEVAEGLRVGGKQRAKERVALAEPHTRPAPERGLTYTNPSTYRSP